MEESNAWKDTAEAWKDTAEVWKADNEAKDEALQQKDGQIDRYKAYIRIRSEQGQKAKARKEKSRFFTKAYKVTLREDGKSMGVNEGYLLCRLMPYMKNDDLRKMYLTKDGEKMSLEDIKKLVHPMLKSRSVAGAMGNLVKDGYFFINKVGTSNRYLVNPKYFFDGPEEDNPYEV